MSFKCSERVWKETKHKGSELLVLLAIARHANDDGCDAWPSLTSLAEETRLTERAVRYCIASLEASGELEVEQKSGRGNSHQYKITLGKPENFATSTPTEPENFATLDEDETGKLCQLEPENFATSNRKTLPVPIINLSIEPVHEPVQHDGSNAGAGEEKSQPPTPARLGGATPPKVLPPANSPAARKMALLTAIEESAASLLDEPLTKSQRKYLTGWFNGTKEHQDLLTSEIIERTELSTAGHTKGDCLAYFTTAMHNEIFGIEKPGGNNDKPNRALPPGRQSGYGDRNSRGNKAIDWNYDFAKAVAASSDDLQELPRRITSSP